MTNYIIDPAVFYWINVLSILQTALAVIGSFALVVCFSLVTIYIYRWSYLDEPDEPDSIYDQKRYERDMKEYKLDCKRMKAMRKWAIVTGVVGAVMVIMSIFTPSKQTSIEMMVARTATFDNVNWTVQQVKEIIDYIVSALKGAV